MYGGGYSMLVDKQVRQHQLQTDVVSTRFMIRAVYTSWFPSPVPRHGGSVTSGTTRPLHDEAALLLLKIEGRYVPF